MKVSEKREAAAGNALRMLSRGARAGLSTHTKMNHERMTQVT